MAHKPFPTVDEAWQSYFKIVPKAAGISQITETRRAFYAGATSVMFMLKNYMTPDVPDAVGEVWLEALVAECETFNKDVAEGRA